mgnify:CR=1 FL=1
MAQELINFRPKKYTSTYGSATWFDSAPVFAELEQKVAQLNAEGIRVVSITVLQSEGFHQPGLDRLTATEFALLCEKP